ncbi:hypothetical protein I8752_32335 [Nostocaceae cyanobacterium CENA369]|uniref:Uncharacterized protein n=1 Tax=Dendronalium phyllosphericum CENA369 TaxID=1725256 RepID=A0A8J7I8N8_9NOST|nr:hypothetical protein [Dendronalium phyllosphericum]MBH8577574.1 hypothetical protein [Dendronalium phyllosphericum CENA369]
MTTEINTQDWQQYFIATNLLAIGYNAWNRLFRRRTRCGNLQHQLPAFRYS